MVEFAPLADFLKTSTRDSVKKLMFETMPILTVPNLTKEKLIDQLMDHVRSSGALDRVCRSALKGINKDYLCMTLRQYEPKTAKNLRKSVLIDKFIQLNMPRADGVRDDGPCLAIVPYVDKMSADVPGQLVDFDDNKRKMRKTKKK